MALRRLAVLACTVCGDAPCYAFLSIQLYVRGCSAWSLLWLSPVFAALSPIRPAAGKNLLGISRSFFPPLARGRYREGRREQKCLFAPVFRVRPAGESCGALQCGGFSVCAHGRNRVVIPLGAIQGLGGGSAGGLFWTPAVSTAGGVCAAPAVGGSIPVSASALASSGV